MLKIFLAFSLALNLLAVAYFIKPKTVTNQDLYAVSRVIDGDTFIVAEGNLAGRQIQF